MLLFIGGVLTAVLQRLCGLSVPDSARDFWCAHGISDVIVAWAKNDPYLA